MYLGEILGTFILILLGGGVVANTLLNKTKGHGAGWLVITAGWFIAVMIGVFAAQSAGDMNADLNPAVSFAKYLLHDTYSFQQFLGVVGCQFIGAFFGSVVVWVFYYPHFIITENTAAKLAVFSTSPAINNPFFNFLSEVIASTVLVVGVGAIFGPATQQHIAVGLGPYMVGLLIWGIGLSLGGTTGYAINPARDLAPRLAHTILPMGKKGSSQWGYAWIPLCGPLVGGALGALIWAWVFK